MQQLPFIIVVLTILIITYIIYKNNNINTFKETFTSSKTYNDYKLEIDENLDYNTLENDVKTELMSKYNIYENENLKSFNENALKYSINVI